MPAMNETFFLDRFWSGFQFWMKVTTQLMMLWTTWTVRRELYVKYGGKNNPWLMSNNSDHQHFLQAWEQLLPCWQNWSHIQGKYDWCWLMWSMMIVSVCWDVWPARWCYQHVGWVQWCCQCCYWSWQWLSTHLQWVSFRDYHAYQRQDPESDVKL